MRDKRDEDSGDTRRGNKGLQENVKRKNKGRLVMIFSIFLTTTTAPVTGGVGQITLKSNKPTLSSA